MGARSSGGAYRVNRRLTYAVGDGRVSFTQHGRDGAGHPAGAAELPLLRGFGDDGGAGRPWPGGSSSGSTSRGEAIVRGGRAGRASSSSSPTARSPSCGAGKYGDEPCARGCSPTATTSAIGRWPTPTTGGTFTAEGRHPLHGAGPAAGRRSTTLDRAVAGAARARRRRYRAGSPSRRRTSTARRRSRWPPGHRGEPVLPGTFVDYELSPREYELSVAQTVLRVHTRVADLYNEPMDQTEQQLRLTIEALRERAGARAGQQPRLRAAAQRRPQASGSTPAPGRPPRTTWTSCSAGGGRPAFFLAHPRPSRRSAGSATPRGVYPDSVELRRAAG